MTGLDPVASLRARAADDPDGVAVVSAETSLSAAELWDSAVRFARVLADDGVREGTTAGVSAPALLHPVFAVALWMLGAVGAVMPPGEEGVQAAASLQRIVSTERGDGPRWILLDDAWMARTAAASDATPEVDARPSTADARIVFTSGTTGAPTPVRFTVGGIAERVRRGRAHWMRPSPTLTVLGLGTISGSAALFAALDAGEPYLVSGTADENVRVLAATGAVAVHASPVQLSDLLTAQTRLGIDLPTLRWAQSVGSPLPAALADRLARRLGVDVEVVYGATEVGATAYRRGPAVEPGDVGDILPSVEVEIVDGRGSRMPEGTPGLVRIRELPPGEVPGAWHVPGDRGRVRAGRLTVLGRTDDLINAAGTKVDPARVEAVALAHPGVSEAVAVGVHDGRGVSAVAVVVVAESAVDLGALRARLLDALGDAAPRVIERTVSLPRNENGKVLRRVVAEGLSERLGRGVEL